MNPPDDTPPRLRLVGRGDDDSAPRPAPEPASTPPERRARPPSPGIDDGPLRRARARARHAADRRLAARATPAAPPLRPIDRASAQASAAADARAAAAAARAARDVARENQMAAAQPTLDPADPRWVLATRVASQLEGTLLRPERRARVMRTAAALGIRSFDAGLIIAMVQDAARRGGNVGDVAASLRLVGPPERRRSKTPAWLYVATAAGAAAVVVVTMIRWLLHAE